MHLTYPAKGIMVTTGIVGSSMPIANGLAWAAQLAKSNRIAVACFGDGAANIGAFHEAINLAAVWTLPVVFVCQNNRYAEHTAYAKGTAGARIADRARGYGIPGVHVDGNDVGQMYGVARQAIDRARAGGGPTLIEAMTFRFHGHVVGDQDAYMDGAEKAAAIAADPVPKYRADLIRDGVTTESALTRLEEDLGNQIDEAVEFAMSSPFPDASELTRDVFAAGAML